MTNKYSVGSDDTTSRPTPLLDTFASAAYLKSELGVPCEAKTLAKLRCVGGGPDFRRFGRMIRYERDALDIWAARRLSPPLKSTSQTGHRSINQ